MSHDFKFKFDEMRENNPAKQEEHYPSASQVRNVCFVQSDGKMLFLNYGYLISGEYLPDESTITLNFASHSITLTGAKLELLYQEFFNQVPKIVSCENNRYSEINQNIEYSISSISIEKVK